MNRQTIAMWLRLNRELVNRAGEGSQVCFCWHSGGEPRHECVSWADAKEWIERFFRDHPKNGLIVSEVMGVMGKNNR